MKRRVLAVGIAALVSGNAALAAPAIVVTARSGEANAPETFVDGSVDRGKHALAVDAQGNTYVVGSRRIGSNWRIRTTRYAPDGHELWSAMQPADASNPADYAYGVGADAAGNVYVAATNYIQFVTLKYAPDGTQVWDRRYSTPSGVYQQPRAMAVDAAGNVYVAGRSQIGGSGIDDFDYATVKYDTNGTELWTARYDGPDGLDDELMALAVDGDGGVYVTGQSRNANNTIEYATVKYDAAGAQQWAARYGNGRFGDQANAIVVNGGSVVVTGQANFDDDYDAATVAYDRATGTQQWVARVNGAGSGSLHNDGAMAITRDALGNLYIAGHVWDRDNGLLTAKYDSAGVQQWVRNWSPYAGISGSNIAYSIAPDPDGGVVAAGRAVGFSGFDYGVVKYDATGNRQWTQLFNPPPGTLWDSAGAVAVRNDGVVVVAGTEAWSQTTNGPDRRTTIFIVDGVQATTPRFSIAPSVTGQPYAVNVSVRGKAGFPAGSVLVTSSDGGSCGVVLANGDGSCTLPNAGAGSKNIDATFSSDTPALFASSSGGTTHNVDKAATHLSMTAPPLMRPGEPSTVTVDFGVVPPGAGTPTGNIVVGSGPEGCTIAPPATSCALTLADAATYTVQANYAGDADFLPASASATVRVNRAPTTTNDNYIVAEDNLLIVVPGAGVLSNDTDDEPLQTTPATFAAGGIGGTVTLGADGSFEYDPPANANGVATFSYTASDGAESAAGNVSITVNPVNDPPTFALGANLTHPAATTGAQTVTRFAFNIDLGAPDEAGQPLGALTATVASDPNGVLSAIGFDLDGTLHYTLTGHGGTATVMIARDGGGTDNGGNDTSAPRTFTITVASGVDLGVSVDNGRRYLRAGSAANYTVALSNTGPDTASQAHLSITKPTNLTGYAWTCTRSDAAPCPAPSGISAVVHTLDVPVGVTVTYQVTGTVAALPEQPVTLSASVSAAGSQTELTSANNTASDSDPVGIFTDGFDG